MNWYIGPWKKILDFKGRASRKEFWMFYLFNFIAVIFIGFFGALSGNISASETVLNLFRLVIILPTIAVGVRRMRDGGNSVWWLLLPFVNIVFLAAPTVPDKETADAESEIPSIPDSK